METTERNIFQRNKKPFQMMGEEFNFEFIPSEHFQVILLDLLNVTMRVVSPDEMNESKTQKTQNDYIQETLRNLLNQRVWLILCDVLAWQNKKPVPENVLRKTSSPKELAYFIGLLINDDEILEAVDELMKSLGKFAEKLPQTLKMWENLLPTQNSTPSWLTTSDLAETTSTNSSAVNKFEDTSPDSETTKAESMEEETIHPLNQNN